MTECVHGSPQGCCPVDGCPHATPAEEPDVSNITIVSEHAKRLVREGGVHNAHTDGTVRATDDGDKYEVPLPFTADVALKDQVIENVHGYAGTVTVVDVHHALDCIHTTDENKTALCRPDAEPDRWHWVIADPNEAT